MRSVNKTYEHYSTNIWHIKLRNMIIHVFLLYVSAPEKRFEVWHSRGPREGMINISCLASGAYPEPKLSLTLDPSR
jgi:hypothetical protein